MNMPTQNESDAWCACSAPHIVPAARKGAQAAAQAFTAEERDALGISTLAIATTGTSPLIYLADQLTKRADTLRAHGKFVSTLPACATAADLMRHLDTVPESAEVASAADAAPLAVAEQRYAAAAAAAADTPGAASTAGGSNNTSTAGASNAKGAKPSTAGSLAVPLDAIGPLALAHEPELSRFVEYAHLREMPQAAGNPLEEITAMASRGPMLASLMPYTLDAPAWAPARPQPVDGQHTARRKRPSTPLAAQHDAKHAEHVDMLVDVGDDVKPPMPVSGDAMHGVHASEGSMGGGAAEAKPKTDNGELYADLMSGGLHYSKVKGRGTVCPTGTTGSACITTHITCSSFSYV